MKLLATIAFCAIATAAAAQGKAHLEGKITGQGDNYVFLMQFSDDFQQTDTIRFAADGTYSADIEVPHPGKAYIIVDDIKLNKMLFLEPGMRATFNANITKTKDKEAPYQWQPTYSGDNKDCYDYLNNHDSYMDIAGQWSWERLAGISFKDYRAAIMSSIDSLKDDVVKVKSLNFRRQMMEQLDYETMSQLIRFAWQTPYKKDADFENYMLAFDHNDPNNIDMASSYLRWYGIVHPHNGKDNQFAILQDAFTNQDVINTFADNSIIEALQQAPDNMDKLLAQYKAVSTNKEGWAKADSVYAHYHNMKKGMPAVDFTFSDRNGKQYSLKDFRGKALYIDVWATWCGPCCAEIPYMEKLTKRWKNDKRIAMISISFDSSSKPWLKKLAADKPKWPQYICPENFNSKLCREYSIDAIPRFLLFDKDGKILSLDAPRPSDENIDAYLNDNLK